jgi:ATPase subunit of ABC transporter with duplicated ATPase domains
MLSPARNLTGPGMDLKFKAFRAGIKGRMAAFRTEAGRWRMRVALAKDLFGKPSLLFLDDPMAHLGQEACVWLEDF